MPQIAGGRRQDHEGHVAEVKRIFYVPVLFYPEPWNGIMEHLRLLVGGLDRVRFEPALGIRPDDGAQTATLAERAGVRTVPLGASRSLPEFREVCARERPAVIHIHTPSTASVAKLVVGARLARVPRVIVTYHQVQPDALGRRSQVVNRAGQLLSSRTVAVSRGVAETLAANAGLARGRINVIHNGIQPLPASAAAREALPRRPGDVWAGYFGRLAAEKGLPALLDAAAAVRAGGTPLRLLIAGDGYEREALETRAKALALGDGVLFAGQRDDARALMRDVDFVVHPPRFEGFGLVLVEAMEAGRAVVATDVPGGIPELVRDGENGLLVPLDDVPALAAAMRRLATDAALRERLGAAGRARWEREFTADRMIARTVALYGY
jgi:glycosyltransferase involved in cell wall biosynthesis